MKDKEYVRVMIGSGENSQFITVKKGTRVMLSDGTVIRAGVTCEEFRQEMDKKIDKICQQYDRHERLQKVKTKVLSLFK